MRVGIFCVGLALAPTAFAGLEPRLPAPSAVEGSPLERQDGAPADARFGFRLQNLGSVLGLTPGTRIYKLRDFENRATCYLLTADHPDRNTPPPGSLACVKD